MTFADIPESHIGVRDDWETTSGAIKQTKKPIIKRCRICLPKVRDDKRRVFPGSRVGARDDRVGASGVRDDSAGPPGTWGGHKKRAGRLSSSDFLPAHLLRWRLPTLPLAQYHRRDGA